MYASAMRLVVLKFLLSWAVRYCCLLGPLSKGIHTIAWNGCGLL